MSYAMRQIVPPTEEPVSLEHVKLQCRITFDADDTLLLGYIAAAREHLETVTRKQFLTATWVLGFNTFPCDSLWHYSSYRHGRGPSYIELPRSPLQQVVGPPSYPSVTYTDSAGATQTLSTDVYGVDILSEPGRLYLKTGQSWPATLSNTPNAVQVQFVAGWTTPDRVPATLRQLILLMVAHWYENREATVEKILTMIPGFESLLWGNRLVEVV